MTVPAYIFDKAWAEGNFLIPADKSIRIELRQALDTYAHTGIMFLKENAGVAIMVRARLAAIEAFDGALRKT